MACRVVVIWDLVVILNYWYRNFSHGEQAVQWKLLISVVLFFQGFQRVFYFLLSKEQNYFLRTLIFV